MPAVNECTEGCEVEGLRALQRNKENELNLGQMKYTFNMDKR